MSPSFLAIALYVIAGWFGVGLAAIFILIVNTPAPGLKRLLSAAFIVSALIIAVLCAAAGDLR